MDIFILVVTLIFIIAPLSLLFHELGHVTGAIFRSATKIFLTIGVGKKIATFSMRNIVVDIRIFFVINSFTSTIREQPFTNKEKLFITFMGPLFNFILAIFTLLYYAYTLNQYFYIAFLFNAWLVIMNLVPYKLGQKQSDGYIIAKIVSQKLRG